ncbi:MAG: hypothetical protein GHCLOJNM_01390 [bacterium]|nr:hypothetical protein [bacterium]
MRTPDALGMWGWDRISFLWRPLRSVFPSHTGGNLAQDPTVFPGDREGRAEALTHPAKGFFPRGELGIIMEIPNRSRPLGGNP